MATLAIVDAGATPDPSTYQAYALASVLVTGLIFLRLLRRPAAGFACLR
jgi:hypothetical protein